jgi:hypothetical protein
MAEWPLAEWLFSAFAGDLAGLSNVKAAACTRVDAGAASADETVGISGGTGAAS